MSLLNHEDMHGVRPRSFPRSRYEVEGLKGPAMKRVAPLGGLGDVAPSEQVDGSDGENGNAAMTRGPELVRAVELSSR